MTDFEEQLQETIRLGTRRQDSLNPRKYRYSKEVEGLTEDNTHIVAVVLFGYREDEAGRLQPNNYIVTAYPKEIG